LEKELGTMVQLLVPNLAATQWLHITTQLEGVVTSKYKLDRRLIMLLVPKSLVKQPIYKMEGFIIMAKLWMELSNELKD
jgi:hypothetical protein